MKRLRNKALIIILILIVLSTLSLFVNDTFNKQIAEISNLFSFISSAVTLAIALFLFDKYGLDKKVSDREQNAVLELMDNLSQLTLYIEGTYSGGSITSGTSHNLMNEAINESIHSEGISYKPTNSGIV